jgi:hypothetical protein
MAEQLAHGLLKGPGTLSPGAEQLRTRAMERPGAARGPPSPLLADYLSEHEAAPELRQKLRTLRLWRQQGIGPSWIKIGKLVFYSRSGLLAWLASLERQPVRENRLDR